MPELVKTLLVAALIVTGWCCSSRLSHFARSLSRQVAYLAGAIVLSLGVTGVWHTDEPLGEIHTWTAHGLVIFLWLSVPLAIGISLQQLIRHRPVKAVAQAIGLLAVLVFALLTCFTGYLGPSHQRPIHLETYNRFVVLHCNVLPAITTVLIIAWSRYLRSSRIA